VRLSPAFSSIEETARHPWVSRLGLARVAAGSSGHVAVEDAALDEAAGTRSVENLFAMSTASLMLDDRADVRAAHQLEHRPARRTARYDAGEGGTNAQFVAYLVTTSSTRVTSRG
jgi:hypothetical protein